MPDQKITNLEATPSPESKTTAKKHFFRASAADFKKIPGSPIAYWISENERSSYLKGELLEQVCFPKKGIDTGENDFFLRLWFEIEKEKFSVFGTLHFWFPYNKGGGFRRWYGNREFLVFWANDGEEIKKRLNNKSKKPTIRNAKFHFQEGLTWTTVSSGGFSARFCPAGALFDNGGCTIFADKDIMKIASFVNSKVMARYLEFLSPTLNFQPGDICRVLFPKNVLKIAHPCQECVELSKLDWDSYETSWDYADLPRLQA